MGMSESLISVPLGSKYFTNWGWRRKTGRFWSLCSNYSNIRETKIFYWYTLLDGSWGTMFIEEIWTLTVHRMTVRLLLWNGKVVMISNVTFGLWVSQPLNWQSCSHPCLTCIQWELSFLCQKVDSNHLFWRKKLSGLQSSIISLKWRSRKIPKRGHRLYAYCSMRFFKVKRPKGIINLYLFGRW